MNRKPSLLTLASGAGNIQTEDVMSVAIESTTPRRHTRLYLTGLVVWWGILASFTAMPLLPKDHTLVPAYKVKLSGLVPVPQQAFTYDWPQWRGPNRDGVSVETGLLTSWGTGEPRLRWEKPAGEGFSAVSVARGRAFTMLQDGDDEA